MDEGFWLVSGDNVVRDGVTAEIAEPNATPVEGARGAPIEATVAGLPGNACNITRLLPAEPLVRVDGTDKLASIVTRAFRAVAGRGVGSTAGSGPPW